MTEIMRINFNDNGTTCYGTLTYKGKSYSCLGKPGYPYPGDSTINVSDKDHNHYSKEFKVELPYAIKLDGTRGIYIHEDVTSPHGNLAAGRTHGCINLPRGEAKQLYDALQGRT